MSFSQLKYRRLICLADLHAVLTPAGKSAALWGGVQIRRRTRDRDQLFVFLRINGRKAAKKSYCIRMSRIVKDISYRASLHDLSRIHYRYFICQICHNAQVVGDQDDGSLCLLFDLCHKLHDLGLDGHVQSRGKAHQQ